MGTIAAYVGATTLFGVSAALFKGTSPFSETGCIEFSRRQNRRMVGHIVLVLAALVLAMGIVNQVVTASP
jgi:hypothetical protein